MRSQPRPLPIVILALAVLISLVNPAVGSATAQTPTGVDVVPVAPADDEPDAVIRRTSFGIPHVVARDWTSLGFGHGYAIAEDSPCVLANYFLTAGGQRSQYLGGDVAYSDGRASTASNLQIDTVMTAWREAGVVEGILAAEGGPSDRARALVQGYARGYNRFLEEVGGAAGITDPSCADAAWVQPIDALDVWYGLLLTNALASSSLFIAAIADATPPTAENPGQPVDECSFGIDLPFCEAGGQAFDSAATPDLAAIRASFGVGEDAPLASNATALGSDVTATGSGMLLGNPHFPWLGQNRFHQVQLTIPGVYDVAGASLHGSPVVQIGWNDDVSWTHTVSTAFRFTPYEYALIEGDPTAYYPFDGSERPVRLERQEVSIQALQEDGTVQTVAEDVWRTQQGLVLDAPDSLLPWTTESVWALRDANTEHLAGIDSWLDMGAADSTSSLLDAQNTDQGVPWVNTIAADRDGNALYADHSVVPNVSDELVEGCITRVGVVLQAVVGVPGLSGNRASSDCAWKTDDDAARPGIFGPQNLPQTTRDDWVINANDSYWLPNPDGPIEGFAAIIGCESCERSLRTRMVYRYVLDRLDGSDGLGDAGSITIDQLQALQTENRVFAAELAREDDALSDVCDAADVPTEACRILQDWDGRTDLDSVGAALFREFWLRLTAAPWEVPFDPSAPLTTPRDLNEDSPDVVAAFEDAFDRSGVPLDVPLGALQVALDDGPVSATIGVQGGLPALGNANAVLNVPVEGLAPYGVIYGSSHIQAVAFTDDGVDARTILTYGNSTDPTSPHATDQTRLWADERWVDWALTEADQLADPGYRAVRVTSDAVTDLTPLSAAVDPGRSGDPTADVGMRVERVAGAERIATAVEVSRRTFASADTAVLVRADEFPDALSGAPLATSLGGPLLLTHTDDVPESVLSELDRLGVTDVVILGGTAAVGQQVSITLTEAGFEAERIAGADRYETSAAIADRIVADGDAVTTTDTSNDTSTDTGAFLTTGTDFADALSAAGVAGSLGEPVLLTAPDALPEVVADVLDTLDRVVIVGGTAAISAGVQATASARVGVVDRVAGANRYETSREVLLAGLDRGLEPSALWLASGQDFPDALSAGASAGLLGTGVVLVDDTGTVAAALSGLDVATVLVAGGPTALADGILEGLTTD